MAFIRQFIKLGFAMQESASVPVERSPSLVRLGWITLFILYWVQVGLLVAFLERYLLIGAYVFWFLLFSPACLWILCKFIWTSKKSYADNDKRIQHVWFSWGLYILAYVITVAMIFGKVAHKLTKDDVLGINALMGTLCITPVLLIILLQLTICPAYQKHVLLLSVFAALNIFDGIEMLEIFLMQNEADFDLNKNTEICIVVFACFCFLLSPLGLVRNKFVANGVVKLRKGTSIFLVHLEIIGINLPFLVLRAVIWRKYEAAIFMTKNIIALVIGVIEYLVLIGICKCGGNAIREQVHHI